jgi:CheY-like chemotaxis protein
MAKRDNRTTPRAWRPARTPIQGVRAKLDNLECTVANLSSTGAMLRSRVEAVVGREMHLLVELAPRSIAARVRVVRCESIEVGLPGEAVWRRKDYVLGVTFLESTGELTVAIRSVTKQLTGIEHSEPRVLVLGKDDEVSRLIEKTLSGSDYMPRILTHPRYALSTVKRIGAKAVIVNLEIDPDFSARSVFDNLRADPATARLPIIICARQAWLQSTHRDYIQDKRLRLLLVPFTPEELVLTLDRALADGAQLPAR